jgi:hypothetical protein
MMMRSLRSAGATLLLGFASLWLVAATPGRAGAYYYGRYGAILASRIAWAFFAPRVSTAAAPT